MTASRSASPRGPDAALELEGLSVPDELRARRREFVRTHHPDHGGDPATFITGLAALTADHDDRVDQLATVSAYRRVPVWRRPAAAVRRRRQPHPPRVR